MAPLAGARSSATVEHPVGEDRGADAEAEQSHDRMGSSAACPEPHLSLTEGLRPVVDQHRYLDLMFERRPQGDVLPPEPGCMNPLRTLLNHPWHADADAEHRAVRQLRRAHEVADAGGDRRDHLVRRPFPRAYVKGHLANHAHLQVEGLDADARLADIDADRDKAWVRFEQDSGSPAVGLLHSGLEDQPLGEEIGDDIRDTGAA